MHHYDSTRGIKNFKSLRVVALFAGGLGAAQAACWIGLTVTAILAYNCLVPLQHAHLTYGSLQERLFLDIYFKGSCEEVNYEDYNRTMLETVPPSLKPTEMLIWVCIYLAVAVIWLLTSVLLMTQLEHGKVRKTVGILYTWLVVTGAVCILDVALGIIFGVDYGRYSNAAYTCYGCNLNSINAGVIDYNSVFLLGAAVTAISLMIIAFKGFVLWIANVCFVGYFLKKAFDIMEEKKKNDDFFMTKASSDDFLATRPPINAYEEQKPNYFTNQAFVSDNPSERNMEVNEESIARAARMSTDASLQERRFRSLDTFQQYPPPRYGATNPSAEPHSSVETVVVTTAYPHPDYSPVMVRAHQKH